MKCIRGAELFKGRPIDPRPEGFRPGGGGGGGGRRGVADGLTGRQHQYGLWASLYTVRHQLRRHTAKSSSATVNGARQAVVSPMISAHGINT